MHGVKFGLFLPTGDFPKARAAAEWADRSGFYSISINDHFFSPLGTAQTPQLECFSTLSALAAVTQNVRLVPAVTAIAFRTPAMLAKIASTLDHLSNGRLIMGLGAGWQRSEYDAHGYPYPSNAERPISSPTGSSSSNRCGPRTNRLTTAAIFQSRRPITIRARYKSRIRR